MARAALLAAVLALATAPAATAAVRVVEPFPPERYADEGAIGLVVPGAGENVTRASALHALLTGELVSSYLGGTPPGEPKVQLGEGPPPDVLVTLPPPGVSENDRYPIARVGGAKGLLTSDSTRIDGLVSITDVANGKLRVVASDDPVGALERLERRIERNDDIRLPLTIALIVALYSAGVFAPRLGPRILLAALALNLWLVGWWLAVPLALAVALLPLRAACPVILAAYLAVLGLDPEAVALSPFGPSQAGRFYGLSNLLSTMLLLPALLGAALLGRLGVLVAGLAVVTVGGNRFGADGGGLLVLLAGYAVLAMRLLGARVTAARGALIAAGAVALAVVLVGLDAASGGSSHVTDALGDGPGELLRDLGDRIEISWRRVTDSAAPAVVAACSLVVLGWVALRRRRFPVTDALLAALLVSIVVNDTPTDVIPFGAGLAYALYAWERTSAAIR